jgi:hypothetical protein
MWIEVFYRTRALINIVLHRYMFPSSPSSIGFQLSTSDAETIVLFEKVVDGNFELATDKLLERSFKVLRSLYSKFQQREISLQSTKETKLLLEVVNGKKTPDYDCEKLNGLLSDENFTQGFNGLEAEFFVLMNEIKEYRKSPLLYDRIYRQSRRFHFDFHRDRLDPDGKIMQSLLAVHDEVELNREHIICISEIHTHPRNNNHLSDLCLHIILRCNDVEMIENFVKKKEPGRPCNDSLHEYIKNELQVWFKCGMIKEMPNKISLRKVLQKLRTSPYVTNHLRRLKST